MNNKIGKKICEARKKLGITQADLAEKLFVSDKTVSNWETGKNIPEKSMIEKIEQLLDVKLAESKLILLLKIIFIIILIGVLLIFIFCADKNEKNIFSMSLDSDNFVLKNSFIVKNNNEVYVNIGSLYNNALPFQPSYILSLYYIENNREVEIVYNKNYEHLYKIDNENIKVLDNINNIYLRVRYVDYFGRKIEKDIKVNMLDDFDNINKNDNLVNLLINNGYKEIEYDIYEKISGSDIYRYDVIDNILYYSGEDKDIKYYALLREDKTLCYCVFKDDVLLEYNLMDESNGEFYEDIIESKITEYKKIQNKKN